MERQDINLEQMEQVINGIFPGLTMYVRDVNLSPICAEKYQPDMIIKERGFTDASNRVMGMITTHRFAILSNHMADFRPYEHSTNWGLFVAQSGSHFKVLDVYRFRDRTQITLLHLPDDERWKVFENVKISIEDQITEMARKRFEAKSVTEPIPELSTEVWLQRCSSPLGMDEQGKLFEKE